ncbi:MAG: hypothetical protein CMK63_04800 [Pseudoalteromonadaceae bacterium]|nr:hypothetical protein [Pseudoalteromonadaceae bacterium]|tara:strand:- start:3776 stop:4312 length:537 start_codon:yes stop_codon:yes gene_type:complete
MGNWIDNKNILKWVEEDNHELSDWLKRYFDSSNFYDNRRTLNTFIREEVKRISSDENAHKAEIYKLYKHWKNYEKKLNNKANNVGKLQLELPKRASDRLKVLSNADGVSQSKYLEKLINFAHKNPKQVSPNTKAQPPYELKTRSYCDSGSLTDANSKILKEKLDSIDEKVTKLLTELS